LNVAEVREQINQEKDSKKDAEHDLRQQLAVLNRAVEAS
jgi:hypothetical protein